MASLDETPVNVSNIQALTGELETQIIENLKKDASQLIPVFTGATATQAGKAGLVPAPEIG